MKSLLSLLVRCFPSDFRAEFGLEIKKQLNTDFECARDRGRLQALAFFVLNAVDLIWSGTSERWNPTWVATQASIESREGEGMMRALIRDLYYAYRSLRRAPGFVVMTAGTLALAIGAVGGIFSVVDGVLLNPLPYPNTDRLVSIAATAPGSDLPDEFGVSAEFAQEYRTQAKLLEDVATYNSFTATLRVDDRTERVRFSRPSPSLFSTLQVTPILGRLPVAEDEAGTAVISHAAWVEWFGSDPEVIGRSYEMIGELRTVVGVMGPDFGFPSELVLAWVPQETRREDIEPGRFGLNLVARVAPDVERAALVSELAGIATRLPELYGGSANYARTIEQYRPVVRTLEEEILGDIAGPLWVLLGAVAVVLLIACANVMNLFLVRAERRQRDLAVRRAIGAGRGQLVRSQLAEAILIAGIAGAAAVGIAWAGLPAFISAAPAEVPRLSEVSVSGETLGFTLLVSFFAALVCGLLPAFRSAVSSLTGLSDGARGSTRRSHRGRNALVVGQTALALVLLAGAGLLVRSYQALSSVDPGYDTEDIFTFQIAPDQEEGLTDGPSFARFHMDFMERLAALPGVESVGIVENVPLNEGVRIIRFVTEQTVAEPDAGTLLGLTWAAGDYFATMGIEVLRGRPLEEADHVTNLGNVVISQAAADLLWPGEEAVGQRLQVPQLGTWETVVGVVEDVLQSSFRDEPQPLVYFPLVAQTPEAWALASPAYVVKTARVGEIAPEVRAIVREIAPSAPMYRVFTMEDLAADSMVGLSFTMLTLGMASALALVLGIVGLYGVLSYVVAERTREIGVRMALGAEAQGVRRMVVVQGVRVVTVGVVVGVLVAAGVTRTLSTLLFGVEAVDVVTFLVVSGLMLLVGVTASYLPARRASNVDPVEALRAG